MAGRPKVQLDTALIEKLASIQCSISEMASILGCHPDTLRDNYSTSVDKGRQHGRMSLRRKQWDTASSGNVTMLIWLGKQYLGQSDRSIDEYLEQAIEAAGITKEDLLELINRKDELRSNVKVKSFHEFVARAGYPAPYDLQVAMKEFGIELTEPRLLLGSRGYGKTEYVVIMGAAYELYLEYVSGKPIAATTLLITKSRERNAAILHEIHEACMKNGVMFDQASATRLRVRGLQGKDHSFSAVTIRSVTLRGRHPKRIIMDDPVTEDDTSETTRALAQRVLNEAMKLTQDILLIGQPAHQYDLYAGMRGKVKTMEVPFGSIPELDHDLDAQRLAGVSEESIQKSYYLNVVSEGSTPFNSVKYLDAMPPGSAVAMIDPSEGGDYTALTILKAYMGGVAVFGKVWKRAWNHCLDDMVPLLAKFEVKRLAFETNCTGEMPIEMLRELFTGIGVVGRHSNSNKHSRIMAAGAYAHLIHLSKQSDKLYLDHVVKYEYKSKFDDAPDSLAMCLNWVGLIKGKA